LKQANDTPVSELTFTPYAMSEPPLARYNLPINLKTPVSDHSQPNDLF